MEKIVVTGIGIISAIGNSVAANHAALVEGSGGISKGSVNLSSRYAGLLPFGEVSMSNADLISALNIADKKGVTRTTLLAMYALDQAVTNAGLSAKQLTAADTALVGATTIGGMCLTDQLYANTHGEEVQIDYVQSYDYSSMSLFLQEQYGLTGPANTINTACSSSANAIMYGARLIKSGLVKRAIVGGADSLAKFSVNGFNALRILSDEVCTPFDSDRKGLNLGEGAAFLILERESDAAGKKVYAELSGYANANDSYHPSSLSPDGDGPYLSMHNALKNAGLGVGDIDFINAHGTATENNDEVELHAMQKLFPQLPQFASTKGFTGHTLGAASAIEAVYCILSLERQEIYPNINFSNSIAQGGQPVTQHRAANLRHVMSNSFGFGGNCTSLIFSKV